MTTCTVEIGGKVAACFDCAGGLTLLDAASAAGWELPHSCRRGSCESCRVTVLEGQTIPAAQGGTVLLCQVRADSDLRIAANRIEPVQKGERRKVQARLFRKRLVADDVCIVDLRFPAGVRIPFKAGQYLHVLMEGEQPRSFSMANSPKANDGAQLQVRVLPGSIFGERILATMQAGQTVELELPFGDFYLREGALPVVLVAGGTGFAPIQSLLEEALPKYPDRSFTLYWGARHENGLYAMEQIQKWQRRHANFHFVGTVSDGPPPAGCRSGLVHEAVLADHANLTDHQAYVCGAPLMVSACREAFIQTKGLPAANFFADAFVSVNS